jgi:FkbM family methyltransferase
MFGQERELYNRYNLNVIWIEPIPEIYDILTKNLEGYDRQRAFQHLITDKDNKEYEFHIANNYLSSSILDLKLHRNIWPEVDFDRSIKLKSRTLSSVIDKENIDSFAPMMTYIRFMNVKYQFGTSILF